MLTGLRFAKWHYYSTHFSFEIETIKFVEGRSNSKRCCDDFSPVTGELCPRFRSKHTYLEQIIKNHRALLPRSVISGQKNFSKNPHFLLAAPHINKSIHNALTYPQLSISTSQHSRYRHTKTATNTSIPVHQRNLYCTVKLHLKG